MTASGRSPRIWIDVDHGAAFGSPTDSISVFEELRGCFVEFTEAWLFGTVGAPQLRGCYYPVGPPGRAGVPTELGPGLVLIDEGGDQLWLSGASSGGGAAAMAAVAVLEALRFSIPPAKPDSWPLDGYAEVHFMDRHVAATRSIDQPVPAAPPGRTFISGGRLICRMDFDKGGVSAADLRQLWSMATEPGSWLGRPTRMARYDGRSRSEASGHAGCQFIAVGESGRELWFRLPEPDNFDALSGRRRDQYEGAFTEYQAVTQAIFRGVGVDIDPPDDRTWREKILGRHRTPPEINHWP